MGGTRRDGPRERKRAAILRAAVEVFARRGYTAARMREVAEHAGVADGTLYLYFRGKEALLIATLEEHGKAFLERATRDAGQLSDPRQKLVAVVERHLASLERDRALAHVFQIELRHSRRFLREVARGQVAEYLHLIERIVREGAQSGQFRRDIPPETAARAIFGALDELVTAWVLAARPRPLAEQGAPLVRLLMEGLERRGGGAG
ncbi:MAG TPA: TetR/AcrR family transcriptional regulator [Thermoanaerobaculaceae bacterium]|nr:TetR/AcrR family transcriptional regulator [Thermoanaerobaculaceae bacterium]